MLVPTVLFILIISDSRAQYGLPRVRVNKCCEIYEILLDDHCVHVNETNETIWHPIFTSEAGRENLQVEFMLIPGSPDCGSMQEWPVYQDATDELKLLPDGIMRHYLHHALRGEESGSDYDNRKELMYHDYPPGKYCMEKRIMNSRVHEFARVCLPNHQTEWTSTKFLMRNVINPVSHALSIVCFLFVAIIYFIMPTLRDLVGNIMTTLSVCLIICQVADMIRLLTVFSSHVSIIVSEVLCYVALLGAFFWLNSLGYYVWKTFKSKNVFLRITDGKKYCYYSGYVWSCTVVMGALALSAHYTMDYPSSGVKQDEQETIGSLGIIIFFVPVSFTVVANMFFFASTARTLKLMNTYGRIHHKLKHSFRMFLLLFLLLTITWLFFLLSFTKFDGLIYCYIIVNAIQAPLFLHASVFNQKHVAFLVHKTCCYVGCPCSCCRPEPDCEWGDEMTAMNAGVY